MCAFVCVCVWSEGAREWGRMVVCYVLVMEKKMQAAIICGSLFSSFTIACPPINTQLRMYAFLGYDGFDFLNLLVMLTICLLESRVGQ